MFWGKKSGKAFVVMRETGPKQVSRVVIEKLMAGAIGHNSPG